MKYPIQIVGAGPGSVELLTLQAHRILLDAQIILYDHLVSQDILAMNSQAKKIYVGRSAGDRTSQSHRQNHIHQLMEKYFLQGKKVLRLKSGDVLIYGRAAEDMKFLSQKKIPFQIVPGLSSGLAAASLCQIPLTERTKIHAAVIATAQTVGNISLEEHIKNLNSILEKGNTIILYMASRKFPQLAKCWEQYPNPPQIHAISHVSLPTQKHITGNAQEILQQIQKKKLVPPLIFIIQQHNPATSP
ncbi:MAG: uroporphyrinogen-III C-methyltransferase [Cytophagales bacterium]|nr:uroporphyrinogen-III C-methyltransferase [Cytophagales bacterium]